MPHGDVAEGTHFVLAGNRDRFLDRFQLVRTDRRGITTEYTKAVTEMYYMVKLIVDLTDYFC